MAKHCATRVAPLLHYYSILNMAKAFIYMESPDLLDNPRNLLHGLTDVARVKDPGTYELSKEVIKINQGIFKCLYSSLTGNSIANSNVQILDLLRACSWISSEVGVFYKKPPTVVDMYSGLLRNEANTELWAALMISRDQLKHLKISATNLQARFPVISSHFTQVESLDDAMRFESGIVNVNSADEIQQAVVQLRTPLRLLSPYRPIRRLVEANPTQTWAGYKVHCGLGRVLPQACAIFGVAFYLSSLVRYQPHVLDRVLATGDAWVIESFLSQCPLEFAYSLLNHMWRTEYLFKPAT